jgi:ribonuclease-3
MLLWLLCEASILNSEWSDLEERLGYTFASKSLLLRALTHRSFSADHNERLEFLGDAVLSASISGVLYAHFAESDEGDLTRVRAHLVCQDTLYRLAAQVNMQSLLRLSEGEARSGGSERPSMLADAMEAVIGAIFLDGGFAAAQALVKRLFAPLLAQTVAQSWSKDAKTALQEWLQARKLPVPLYSVAATQGKQHDQLFTVECRVPQKNLLVCGEGRSRRAAEQEAAKAALAHLYRLQASQAQELEQSAQQRQPRRTSSHRQEKKPHEKQKSL